MAPTKLIAGNWKMNGTAAAAQSLVRDICTGASAALGARADLRIAVCPPAPLLAQVVESTRGGPIKVGAQDCHAQRQGAHTGDISAWLLADIGCTYVIVGHSERRTDHGETDAVIRAKAGAVLAAGLTPIICVGETEVERDSGQTEAVVARQVAGSVPSDSSSNNSIIAYEPVWAIGTGKTPTNEDIAKVHSLIRSTFSRQRGPADGLTILYGGSVKGSNAAEILALEGVDGALVGGASLNAADFLKIIGSVPK